MSKPNEILVPSEEGPTQRIDLGLSTREMSEFEYSTLKLLESIAWSLSGIDVTLRLEREDRLQRERETHGGN